MNGRTVDPADGWKSARLLVVVVGGVVRRLEFDDAAQLRSLPVAADVGTLQVRVLALARAQPRDRTNFPLVLRCRAIAASRW